MEIQKLYIENGEAKVIDPITGEFVVAEFGHLHYGTNFGRDAVSVGMWMSHKTNMNERGIDSHLTTKERHARAGRDYMRFWTYYQTTQDGNAVISKRINRKSGNVIVNKCTKYINEQGHACNLLETWSEKVKPFSGVLTVQGLDVLSGWEKLGGENENGNSI